MFTVEQLNDELARRRVMADLTFTFGSSYGSGSSMGLRKRPRTAYDEAAAMKAPSKIEDRRVAISALRSVNSENGPGRNESLRTTEWVTSFAVNTPIDSTAT
jgi:hypothetical protein